MEWMGSLMDCISENVLPWDQPILWALLSCLCVGGWALPPTKGILQPGLSVGSWSDCLPQWRIHEVPCGMCVSGSSFFIAELCFLCLFVHILVTLGCWFGAIMDKAAVDNGLSKNLWVSSVLAALQRALWCPNSFGQLCGVCSASAPRVRTRLRSRASPASGRPESPECQRTSFSTNADNVYT